MIRKYNRELMEAEAAEAEATLEPIAEPITDQEHPHA